jgi:hypothetical protein
MVVVVIEDWLCGGMNWEEEGRKFPMIGNAGRSGGGDSRVDGWW